MHGSTRRRGSGGQDGGLRRRKNRAILHEEAEVAVAMQNGNNHDATEPQGGVSGRVLLVGSPLCALCFLL